MRRGFVTCVVGAALVVGTQASLAQAGEEKAPKPPSLYKRVGGYDALAALFDGVAPKMATDPQFARFFTGHATDSDLRQRQRLLELLCQEAGGPCFYTGRSLKTAHGGLGVSEADWSAFLRHLTATLDEMKLGPAEKDEVVALVSRYKSDIVEKP